MELKRGRVGPDDVRTINALHKEGKSIADIAKEMKRSENAILKVLGLVEPDAPTTTKKAKAVAAPAASQLADPMYELFLANKGAIIPTLLHPIEKEYGFKVKNPTANGETVLKAHSEIKSLKAELEKRLAALKALALALEA